MPAARAALAHAAQVAPCATAPCTCYTPLSSLHALTLASRPLSALHALTLAAPCCSSLTHAAQVVPQATQGAAGLRRAPRPQGEPDLLRSRQTFRPPRTSSCPRPRPILAPAPPQPLATSHPRPSPSSPQVVHWSAPVTVGRDGAAEVTFELGGKQVAGDVRVSVFDLKACHAASPPAPHPLLLHAIDAPAHYLSLPFSPFAWAGRRCSRSARSGSRRSSPRGCPSTARPAARGATPPSHQAPPRVARARRSFAAAPPPARRPRSAAAAARLGWTPLGLVWPREAAPAAA